MIILRMRATVSMPASSAMVGGMVARIHMLPSSSFGRNSVPSRMPRIPQTIRKAAATSAAIRALPTASGRIA